jgi:hypothetical protein
MREFLHQQKGAQLHVFDERGAWQALDPLTSHCLLAADSPAAHPEADGSSLASAAIHSLSSPLQIEITLHVHRRWLSSTWFLRGLELSLLVRLAQSTHLQTMAPGDVASSTNLYIIERGLVLHGARVLTAGHPHPHPTLTLTLTLTLSMAHASSLLVTLTLTQP